MGFVVRLAFKEQGMGSNGDFDGGCCVVKDDIFEILRPDLWTYVLRTEEDENTAQVNGSPGQSQLTYF